MTHTSIHLSNPTIVLPERITAGDLPVVNGRVAAQAPGAWTIDLRDHLVFPGLINAHDHLQLNNIPPLPHAAPFPNSYAWIAAFQPHFQDPAVAAAVAIPPDLRHWQGGLKNLLCGATTVAHHDHWRSILDDPDFPVRLLRDFGWSHSLGLGLEPGAWSLELGSDQSPFAALRSLARYGPPVIGSYWATAAGRPWIIHLAEGADDLAAGELSLLEAVGCLNANTVLVHGVGLTETDVGRVIARGAAVVWCPGSNIRMLGRTLDPRRLFDAGRLALGSDSRISANRDLLDELRVAAAQSDLGPADLLRLVTGDASRVLAMPDVGGLDPGQHADLLIVADRGGDPYRALVELQRSDIRAVVRGGAPAIADPDFAEWFDACGIATAQIVLDGRPKLIAKALARPDVFVLEPGLDIVT